MELESCQKLITVVTTDVARRRCCCLFFTVVLLLLVATPTPFESFQKKDTCDYYW
jgi:hypothetical protein